MIFPYDVNKVVSDSRKIAGQNKIQAVLVLFIIGSVVLFYVTDMLLGTFFGTGIGLTIGVDATILIFVGWLVFRFIIFDEDLKKKEYEGGESDSFAKYLYLRKDIHTDLIVGGEKVSVFEFINGSSMTVMELRFGSNDDEKAATTRLLYEKLIEIPAALGIETRCVVAPENFKNSKEFRTHVNAINKIEDKKGARNVMVINDAIMEISCQESNVDTIFFMMRTTNNHQYADLEIAVRGVFAVLGGGMNSFRSIHFLDAEELMEFYREFYGIAAIDLSMMRTMDLVQSDEEFHNVVSLYQLRSASGKLFKVDTEVIGLSERKLN